MPCFGAPCRDLPKRRSASAGVSSVIALLVSVGPASWCFAAATSSTAMITSATPVVPEGWSCHSWRARVSSGVWCVQTNCIVSGKRQFRQHDVAEADHLALAVEVERAGKVVRRFGVDAGGAESGVGFGRHRRRRRRWPCRLRRERSRARRGGPWRRFRRRCRAARYRSLPNMMQWLPVPLPSCRPRGVSVRPRLLDRSRRRCRGP